MCAVWHSFAFRQSHVWLFAALLRGMHLQTAPCFNYFFIYFIHICSADKTLQQGGVRKYMNTIHQSHGEKRLGWVTQISTRTRQMHRQCHCWMKSAVWQVCLKTLHLAFWPICCCATSINKRHVSILDVCCLAVLLFNKATFGFLANVLLGYLLGGGLYECISTCGSTAACADKANFTFPD